MNGAATLWIFVFCIAAFLFFGTAVVIAVMGSKDLKELLSRSDRKQ